MDHLYNPCNSDNFYLVEVEMSNPKQLDQMDILKSMRIGLVYRQPGPINLAVTRMEHRSVQSHFHNPHLRLYDVSQNFDQFHARPFFLNKRRQNCTYNYRR